MILADKIIQLRKKSGWSQEELAEKMGVTRQSVSKWEGAQSTPDLEKLLGLGRLFGVSVDYLLKDELEEAELLPDDQEPSALRRVSLAQAGAFLQAKQRTAKRVALAVYLCILSPICLLCLGAVSETRPGLLSANAAGAIGMITLLLFVALAVAIFISCGAENAPYAYLETDAFETEYGVCGMVRERQKQYRPTYTRGNIVGACLCVLAGIPLFVGAFLEDLLLLTGLLSLMLALAGIGVCFFITVGIHWASMEKLLQQGDYTPQKKKNSRMNEGLTAAFWLLAVAIYLGYSFVTDDWGKSWIVWPVAGVLYAAVAMAWSAFGEKKA